MALRGSRAAFFKGAGELGGAVGFVAVHSHCDEKAVGAALLPPLTPELTGPAPAAR
jgi:hypothetical protein